MSPKGTIEGMTSLAFVPLMTIAVPPSLSLLLQPTVTLLDHLHLIAGRTNYQTFPSRGSEVRLRDGWLVLCNRRDAGKRALQGECKPGRRPRHM